VGVLVVELRGDEDAQAESEFLVSLNQVNESMRSSWLTNSQYRSLHPPHVHNPAPPPHLNIHPRP
jgi:hypothetical protein